MVALCVACGDSESPSSADAGDGDGGVGVAPTVVSTSPPDDAIDVPVNGNASAMFSEAMDAASLTGDTFTVTAGAPPVAVTGTVITAGTRAVFWPAQRLASNTEFTATITTGARSEQGVDMETAHVWHFTTNETVAPGLPVELGMAGDFVILAKSGVSTVPTSAITGDIGVSPMAATSITGFSLTADATNVFSTSTQVTGSVYAADYTPPTPSNLTTAVGDMERAFTDAAGRAPDVTELGAGDIGGMTLAPGVYKWGTGLLIPTDVTLSGGATEVWIFQIAQDLTMSSGTQVLLTGGAVAENVFWQVSGLVDLGTTAHCEGVLLAQTSITLRTGATVDGRLLAQMSVDIDGSTVVQPPR